MYDLTLIYEDAAIRVESCLRESETVVFSFNSYSGGDASEGTRAGYPFLPGRGFSAIYVTARQSHWWQSGDHAAWVRAILPLARPYARRIAYGSSMGGYGALLFARDLEATGVVAFVPQTIIGDPRYAMKREWRDAIAKVAIVRDDIADTIGAIPDVRLIYDPWRKIDRAFVDHLDGRIAPRRYLFPFVGHKVPQFLAEIGLVGSVTAAILNGALEPAALRALVRPLRRQSALYRQQMEMRLKKRRHSRLSLAAPA